MRVLCEAEEGVAYDIKRKTSFWLSPISAVLLLEMASHAVKILLALTATAISVIHTAGKLRII